MERRCPPGAQHQLAAAGVAAAWRLGSWDLLDEALALFEEEQEEEEEGGGEGHDYHCTMPACLEGGGRGLCSYAQLRCVRACVRMCECGCTCACLCASAWALCTAQPGASACALAHSAAGGT
jgi:hypothetical protein